MDDKQNKLLVNLVSTFLILLSACLLIALLINLKFQEDCATVIVGMLGVCATLYAPVAAFFFYDSWKDQFYFTKREEAIEKYIEQVSQIQKLIKNLRSNKKYSFYHLNNIKQDEAETRLESIKKEFINEITNIENILNDLNINLRIIDRHRFIKNINKMSLLWGEYNSSTNKLKITIEHYQRYCLKEEYSPSTFTESDKNMRLVMFSQISIYGNKQKENDGVTTLTCSNDYYDNLTINFREIINEI